jgi:hypothetical protein
MDSNIGEAKEEASLDDVKFAMQEDVDAVYSMVTENTRVWFAL